MERIDKVQKKHASLERKRKQFEKLQAEIKHEEQALLALENEEIILLCKAVSNVLEGGMAELKAKLQEIHSKYNTPKEAE